MNESKPNFRQRLLAAENAIPSEKYRRELANLRERKLTRAQQVALILPILFCVSAAFRLAGPALDPAGGLSSWARVGLGAAAVLSLVWAILLALLVKRGVMPRKSDIAGLTRALVIMAVMASAITGFLALAMKDRALGTQVLIVEAIVLLIAGILLIKSTIEQAELRTREKLLELELHITATAECGSQQ
jgi:hypothetical protein